MNHHQAPPLLNLRTTTQILKQTTTTIIYSGHHHLITFLILSFIILSLQTNNQTLTNSLTSFIDDPSMNTILLNFQNPPKPSTTFQRREFLAGTLENDPFAPDDLYGLFFTFSDTLLNQTRILVENLDGHLGFPYWVFKSIEFQENVKSIENGSKNSTSEVIDDGMLFGFKYDELSTLMYFGYVFSAGYWLMIVTFLVAYIWVNGVVFLLIVNDLLKVRRKLFDTFWDGGDLGFRRLVYFVLMKWLVRDGLGQLLRLCYFGGVEDRILSLKVVVWSKFMPFSVVFPLVEGLEMEIYCYSLLCYVLSVLTSFVFGVVAWVVMADSKKSVVEGVKEGYRLLKLMDVNAVNLKLLEVNVCGYFARIILRRAFGNHFAMAIQSVMEVYFLVAWNLYYFSLKSIHANANRVPFGQRELEAMVKDAR